MEQECYAAGERRGERKNGAVNNGLQWIALKRIRLFSGKAFEFCQDEVISDPKNSESMKW